MGVSYNKLWKILIDKNIKKMQLCKLAGISQTTIAKLGFNGDVQVSTLEKICNALNCDFSDIMEYVYSKESE